MTEPYVRPDVRQFLDYLNALPGPKTHELPPAEGREMMKKMRHVAEQSVALGLCRVLRKINDGIAGFGTGLGQIVWRRLQHGDLQAGEIHSVKSSTGKIPRAHHVTAFLRLFARDETRPGINFA